VDTHLFNGIYENGRCTFGRILRSTVHGKNGIIDLLAHPYAPQLFLNFLRFWGHQNFDNRIFKKPEYCAA
jgi:hypothetical protein